MLNFWYRSDEKLTIVRVTNLPFLRADYMHAEFQPGLSFNPVDRDETSARAHEQIL